MIENVIVEWLQLTVKGFPVMGLAFLVMRDLRAQFLACQSKMEAMTTRIEAQNQELIDRLIKDGEK